MRALLLAAALLALLLGARTEPAWSQAAGAPLALPPISRSLDQQLGAIWTESAGNPDQAIARLAPLLLQAERENRAGDRVVILTARAQHEGRANRPDKAVEDLTRAIAISTAYPLPYYLRSGFELRLGHRDRAMTDLDKAIEIEPRFLPAFTARARLLSDARRRADAARDHARVLAVRPDDAQSRLSRAIALSLSGDKQAALAEIDMVRARNPHDPALLLDRAIILRGLGDLDAARAAAERAMEAGDERGAALKERGIIHFTRGDFAAAEQDLKRSFDLGLGAGLPAPYLAVYLEAARLRLGRSDRADLARRQALAFTTGWSNTLAAFLGGSITSETLIARTGEETKGERDAEERLCEAQFFIAQAHLARGATEDAVRAFRAAMATGVIWFNEYEFSRRELERLGRL